MSQDEIARRVADSIPAATTHAEVAGQIGLTKDQLSKSLNGRRAFSSVELAQLADVLDVDVHWLITGRPDPHRLVVAARHNFDHATGRRDVPGRDTDQPVLDDIALSYRQAFASWDPVDIALPGTVLEVKSTLGPNFVRRMADRFETHLDVDVIRLSEISTAYSFHVGPRKVIVLQATGNWFRENWSLAHELGHLVAGHHGDNLTPAEQNHHELVANRFAAELLLPEAQLRRIDWHNLTEGELADQIWDWGVSTDALSRRLEGLGITVSDTIGQALQAVRLKSCSVGTGPASTITAPTRSPCAWTKPRPDASRSSCRKPTPTSSPPEPCTRAPWPGCSASTRTPSRSTSRHSQSRSTPISWPPPWACKCPSFSCPTTPF